MGEVPEKAFFRRTEVCQVTDTQPYVLRFWESEFPQLRPRKNRSGHLVYSRDAVELILEIKKLLYEDELTLSDARERLDRKTEPTGGKRARKPEATAERRPSPKKGKARGTREDRPAVVGRKLEELRERYDAACAEIDRLQTELAGTREMQRELEAARSELNDLRRQLIDRDKADGGRVATLRSEVEKLRKSLRRAEADRKRTRDKRLAVAKRLERLLRRLRKESASA
jgi:DNA-binding transcriptional MerR regulator